MSNAGRLPEGSVMACARIGFLLLFASLSFAAYSADIYKWVDDKGRVQYGQSVPEKYKKNAKLVAKDEPQPTDAQRQEAEARAAKDKADAEALAAQKARTEPANSEPRPRPAPATAAASTGDKASQCEAEKKRYRESEACFAPYRTPTGAIQPEGFQRCVAVKEPTC
jgi:hypothetical protein